MRGNWMALDLSETGPKQGRALRHVDRLMMAERIAAVRAVEGLTQQAMAARHGVSLRSYASWERGEREPGYQFVRSFIHNHNLDAMWLLDGPGRRPRYKESLNVPVLVQAIQKAVEQLRSLDLHVSNDAFLVIAQSVYEAMRDASPQDSGVRLPERIEPHLA